jgi:hypothetical protein
MEPMTCRDANWTATRAARLAAAIALLAAACTNAEDVSKPDPQSLRNGSDHTQRLKGLVDLSDDFNDWTADLSAVHCSGVMLNAISLLTTARCAEKVMRAGLSLDDTRAFRPDLYEWRPDNGYEKHCIWDLFRSCNQAGNANSDTKAEKVSVYSLTSSPDKDLAIVTSGFYPDHGSENDYADIYMDDFSPSTMPRLQLYGWGRAPEIASYPLPVPRTGTMQVLTVTPSRIDLRPDQVQACSGDQGGIWIIPASAGGTGNEVVALESSFTADQSTGCSQSGSVDSATRLRDKMPWIESVVGACGSFVDAAGHNVKRCYGSNCSPLPASDPAGWAGCNGSGCSVCAEQVDSSYPKYFDHHRNCSRNASCNGSFSGCSASCPPPTPEDSCDGLPSDDFRGWDGCRGSGCSGCSDLIDGQYPKYFLRHPDCTRNTSCNGYHYRCSASCPAPTDDDR